LTCYFDEDIPGFDTRFQVTLSATSLGAAILEVIAATQRVGEDWLLRGDIHERMSLSSLHIYVPGVQRCEFNIDREAEGTGTDSPSVGNRNGGEHDVE
jgi:hypothetical protein